MKRILQTNDIKRFLVDVYTSIVYDNSTPFEKYVPDGVWYVLVDGNDVAGLINLQPVTNVLWNTHVIIYPAYRGNGSEEWGKLVAADMKQHGATRFIALTPYENARKYAERVGFKYITTLLNSVKKDGKLLHQHMLEL